MAVLAGQRIRVPVIGAAGERRQLPAVSSLVRADRLDRVIDQPGVCVGPRGGRFSLFANGVAVATPQKIFVAPRALSTVKRAAAIIATNDLPLAPLRTLCVCFGAARIADEVFRAFAIAIAISLLFVPSSLTRPSFVASVRLAVRTTSIARALPRRRIAAPLVAGRSGADAKEPVSVSALDLAAWGATRTSSLAAPPVTSTTFAVVTRRVQRTPLVSFRVPARSRALLLVSTGRRLSVAATVVESSLMSRLGGTSTLPAGVPTGVALRWLAGERRPIGRSSVVVIVLVLGLLTASFTNLTKT